MSFSVIPSTRQASIKIISSNSIENESAEREINLLARADDKRYILFSIINGSITSNNRNSSSSSKGKQ